MALDFTSTVGSAALWQEGSNRQRVLDIFNFLWYNIKKEVFYGSGIKKKTRVYVFKLREG
jgi:hypothetical protein